jgi:hypothetical protein
MTNLNGKIFPDIKIHVENFCKYKGKNEIDMPDIFNSKPDIRKLYPNNISFAFEGHLGPVYGISYSPFHRNLFLTCSLDGSMRLYDLL